MISVTAEERKQKIKEKNSPQFFLKFRDTELLKDTRVSFIIDAKGNPTPTVTIYHDGMILQTETERTKIVKHPDDTYEFSIDKINEEDAGEYTVKQCYNLIQIELYSIQLFHHCV